MKRTKKFKSIKLLQRNLALLLAVILIALVAVPGEQVQATGVTTSNAEETQEESKTSPLSEYEALMKELEALADESKALADSLDTDADDYNVQLQNVIDVFYNDKLMTVLDDAQDKFEKELITSEEMDVISAKGKEIVEYLNEEYQNSNAKNKSELNYELGGALQTADKDGIKINLFDYGSAISNKLTNGSFPTLKFNGGIATGDLYLDYSQEGNYGLWSNMETKAYLDNGYPALSYNENGTTKTGSLKYLFDKDINVLRNSEGTPSKPYDSSFINGSKKTDYKVHRYDVADGSLFMEDDNGYLYYNSRNNHAYYDYDKERMVVMDYAIVPGFNVDSRYLGMGHFLPFNGPLTEYSAGTDYEQIAEKGTFLDGVEKPTANTYFPSNPAPVNGLFYTNNDLFKLNTSSKTTNDLSKQINMWFGMSVEFDFYQPANGQVNGKDMIYEFSGDDFMWVYIDDLLVLDIFHHGRGNNSGAISASINFTTGEVLVYKNDYTYADIEGKSKEEREPYISVDTTLYECYEKALKQAKEDGKTIDMPEFNGDNSAFADYSRHNFKMFYQEYGTNTSNCYMRFNMEPVPTGSVSLKKTVKNYDDSITDKNEKFTFQIEAENNIETLPEEIKYNKLNLNTQKTTEGSVKNGNTFTLSDNEIAYFDLPHRTDVSFKELLGPNTKYVETWTLDGEPVVVSNDRTVSIEADTTNEKELICTNTECSVITDKTVSVPEDGIYTVTLDAYATGVSTPDVKIKPVDVVVLVDVSDSMTKTFDEQDPKGNEQSKLTITKNALSEFIENVHKQGTDNRIAIVAFGTVAETDIGFTTTDAAGTAELKNVVSHLKLGKERHDIQDSVFKRVSTPADASEDWWGGATYPNEGLKEADKLMKSLTTSSEYNSSERDRIVVMFTDGYPGYVGAGNYWYCSDYYLNKHRFVNDRGERKGTTTFLPRTLNNPYQFTFSVRGTDTPDGTKTSYFVANDAIKLSNDIKTKYGATVYSIGAFGNANISLSNGLPALSDADCSMPVSDIVSNLAREYFTGTDEDKNGTAITNLITDADGNKIDNISHVLLGSSKKAVDNVNRFLHLVSSNYMGVDSITDTPSNNVASKYYQSANDANALSNVFNAVINNLTATSVTLDYNAVLRDVIPDGFELAANVSEDDIKVYTSDWNGTSFGSKKLLAANERTVKISQDNGKTIINVSGFSYKDNYVVEGIAGGKKLIVEVPIVKSESNKGGNYQETNIDPEDGIFDGNIKVEEFPLPHVDTPTSVTIKKVVDGTGFRKDQTFGFNIKYLSIDRYSNDEETSANKIDGASNYVKAITESKEETFNLKDGKTKSFSDVYVESSEKESIVQIGENAEAGYEIESVKVLVDGNEKEALSDANNDGIYEVHVTEANRNMTIEVTNKLLTKELVITKNVSGNLGNRDKAFTFNVAFNDQNDSAYAISKYTKIATDGTITEMNFDTNGEFILKHDESVKITVPYNFTYTVSENDYSTEGYITSIDTDDELCDVKNTTVSGTLTGDTNINYTNAKSETIDTGVDTATPFRPILLLAFAIVTIIAGGKIYLEKQRGLRRYRR